MDGDACCLPSRCASSLKGRTRGSTRDSLFTTAASMFSVDGICRLQPQDALHCDSWCSWERRVTP